MEFSAVEELCKYKKGSVDCGKTNRLCLEKNCPFVEHRYHIEYLLKEKNHTRINLFDLCNGQIVQLDIKAEDMHKWAEYDAYMEMWEVFKKNIFTYKDMPEELIRIIEEEDWSDYGLIK